MPAATSTKRKAVWWVAAAIAAVLLLLSLRFGLHAYRCHVVNGPAAILGPLRSEPDPPEWLQRVVGERLAPAFGRPVSVRLWYSSRVPREYTNHLVWCLSGLDSLKSLALDGDGVCDADLLRLHGLHQLEWLSLSDTRVTVAGLA